MLFEFGIMVLVTGLFATVVMDIWSALLPLWWKGSPPPDWRPVGRWVVHLCKGKWIHRPSIVQTLPVARENLIGWCFHYVTGLAYAAGYTAMVMSVPAVQASLGSAVLFGLVTLIAPWFVMLPGFGFGIAGYQTPVFRQILVQSALGHAVFGGALYPGWQLSQWLLASL